MDRIDISTAAQIISIYCWFAGDKLSLQFACMILCRLLLFESSLPAIKSMPQEVSSSTAIPATGLLQNKTVDKPLVIAFAMLVSTGVFHDEKFVISVSPCAI